MFESSTMKRAGLIFLAVLAVLLTGCGLLGKKQPDDTPEATLPTWVGKIVMVDATHRFVLIEGGMLARMAPDADLLAFRERRRTASLRLTAESRPPYLAADIIEGLPAIGDTVALDESRPPEALPTE